MRLTVRAAWALFFLESIASAEPRAPSSAWSTAGARTIAPGRLEAGTFSSWKWAPIERLELGAQPTFFFVFPSVAAKVNWASDVHGSSGWWLSTRHRLSIPSSFLHLIAGEGSGGLLPADTDVPFAIQNENAALLTLATRGHEATMLSGFSYAVREQTDLPMVEFPFVYSLLAPMYSPIVGFFGAAFEGPIAGPLHYRITHRTSVWQPRAVVAWPKQNPPTVISQEDTVRLDVRSGRHQVSAGLAVASAHYPIGYRLHWSPTLDYRFAISE